MSGKLRKYDKSLGYSYAFGAYVVYELLLSDTDNAQTSVYIRKSCKDTAKLTDLCAQKGVEVIFDDRAFDKVCPKENILVFARFFKYTCLVDKDCPHVCLVNPRDAGNLGSIFRTALAFGILNVAIIAPAAEALDPACVRASMGAVFRLNFEMYGSFDEYRHAHPRHSLFPFMTDGAAVLGEQGDPPNLYALVFGGEAAGLPASFADIGRPLRIPQSGLVDSHNLTVAVGIGLYEFMRGRYK